MLPSIMPCDVHGFVETSMTHLEVAHSISTWDPTDNKCIQMDKSLFILTNKHFAFFSIFPYPLWHLSAEIGKNT